MRLEELFKLTSKDAERAGGKPVPHISRYDAQARARNYEKLKERRMELLCDAFHLLPTDAAEMRDWQLQLEVLQVLDEGTDNDLKPLTEEDKDLLLRLLGTIPPKYVKRSGRTVNVRKERVTLVIDTGHKVHAYAFPKSIFEDL